MRTLKPTLRAALVATFVASVAVWPSAAHAESDTERATARTLAEQGFKAVNEQRWADAVDLFKRAESLVHAPAHLLYLGRAYAHVGKLVEAHEALARLNRETLPSNAPRASVRAQQDGAKDLAELEGRIPTLDIAVKPSAPGLTVKIDDTVIPPAMVGTAVPIDPGSHTVAAAADGFTPASRTVQIAEGSHGSVALELKAIPGYKHDAAPVRPVVASGDKGAAPLPDTPPTEGQHGSGALRVVGYVTLGVAALAAGAGAFFVFESHDNRSQGDALCPSNNCKVSDQGQLNSLNDKATLFGELAVTSFIVAGAAAATGITSIVLSSGKPSDGTTALWVGPGQMGLRGSF